MRSRYTAYAMGGYGEYLLSTWHKAQMPALTAQSLSESSQQWYRLEIVDKSQIGDRATVEFKAYYLNKDSEPCMLHERSDFIRESGVWLYLSGEIL